MKVKLKSWDEVVRLGKQHGDYDDSFGVDEVLGLTDYAISWGDWIEGKFTYDIDSGINNAFIVDGGCPYYLKAYMIEDE